MTHGHSQHSQTQDSYWAVSTQHWLPGQPKKNETTQYFLFSNDTNTHTRSSSFTQLSYSTQTLLYPICPLPPFSSSQSALCSESKCLCVCEGHSGAWCGLGQTDWLPRPRDQQILHTTHPWAHACTCAHTHNQKYYQLTNTEMINNWYMANNLPCSR